MLMNQVNSVLKFVRKFSQNSVQLTVRRMPLYPEPKFRGPKRTKKGVPLSRVELHIHLDGSVRMSTVWELCKQKGTKRI